MCYSFQWLNVHVYFSKSKGNGVGCGPWIENMERATTSKEDPASSPGGIKGREGPVGEWSTEAVGDTSCLDAKEDIAQGPALLQLNEGEKRKHFTTMWFKIDFLLFICVEQMGPELT